MRMGYEILTEGKVLVNRNGVDAEELLAVKNGAWSFDQVMEFKDSMEKKLDAEYLRQKQLVAEGKPTPLPREVNKEQLNTLYHQLYEEYWQPIPIDTVQKWESDFVKTIVPREEFKMDDEYCAYW
jgi:hypothetical protein